MSWRSRVDRKAMLRICASGEMLFAGCDDQADAGFRGGHSKGKYLGWHWLESKIKEGGISGELIWYER